MSVADDVPFHPRYPDLVDLRYRREVRPLVFPESEPEERRVPEGKQHVMLKFFLFALLRRAFAAQHTIACDQFIYWNARNPRRRCAPDAAVKLGRPDDVFRSWKTWERGTPELIVEIEGEYSGKKLRWERRFERFQELGAHEIVRFDYEAPPGRRITVWDRIEDDIVERIVDGEVARCLTLGLWWVVGTVENLGPGLRLARDRDGRDLLLSPDEENQRRIAELEAQIVGRPRSRG
jgi:hypothetical protein